MSGSRIVAVFSGGGAKAAAHVGAVQALAERGLSPVRYVATSMGAVVAACFASGMRYSDVVSAIVAVSRRDVARFSPSALFGPFASSLFQARPLKETIQRLTTATRFEELAVPLTVTAVDVKSGELALFGAGGRMHVPLADALYASCALPLYYPPGRIGDREYMDGGMRAVLPLDVAATFDHDLLFAVDVGPSLYAAPADHEPLLPAMVRVHDRAMRILLAAQTEETIVRWRKRASNLLLVRPKREQQVTFSVDHVVRYVEEGYRAAHEALETWFAQRKRAGE